MNSISGAMAPCLVLGTVKMEPVVRSLMLRVRWVRWVRWARRKVWVWVGVGEGGFLMWG